MNAVRQRQARQRADAARPKLGGILVCPVVGARPVQEDLREAGLLEMDELPRAFDRSKRRALVLAAGEPPLIVLHHEDRIFDGMFDK